MAHESADLSAPSSSSSSSATPVSPYHDLDAIMSGQVALPTQLDWLEFSYRGIEVRAYGFLHGVTGGPSADYRAMVHRAAETAPGLVLCEMGMSRPGVGLGLHGELDDFVPIAPGHAFRQGLLLGIHPLVLGPALLSALHERLRRRDPWMRGRGPSLVDLARSAMFHAFEPSARRRIMGFLPPQQYLELNLARNRGEHSRRGQRFPDIEWSWLTLFEPWADIALRSVHMLEFAAELARLQERGQVSLFVGEVHNTDMAWLAAGGSALLSHIDQDAVERVRTAARRHAVLRAAGRRSSTRLRFAASALAGVVPLWVAAWVAILHVLH
jgi:hypothetical protein